MNTENMAITEHRIDFHGDEVLSVKDENGQIYVPLRRLCENIGTTYQSQVVKVRSDARFNCHDITTVAEDGKNRSMLCLPLDKISAWLMIISPNKVHEGIRERLIRYQTECAEALYSYWTKGAAINPRVEAIAHGDAAEWLAEQKAASVPSPVVGDVDYPGFFFSSRVSNYIEPIFRKAMFPGG
jgi:hypothetical protein